MLLEMQPFFGCRRELTFGQTVNAVVLHDVNHIHIAAHGMFELTHTNAGAVAIARNTDALHVRITEQRAGGNGRHTSMQRVETKAAVHEVGWRLGRTTDAGKLDDIFRQYAHLVHRSNDLI